MKFSRQPIHALFVPWPAVDLWRLTSGIAIAILLASVPGIASAQTYSVSPYGSGGTIAPSKPKPKPTPTPTPKPSTDPNYTRTATNTSGTADQWSAGTNWDLIPTSGTAEQLVLGGAVPASLAAGVNIFTNNDIAGNFQLNILDFTYAGPSTTGSIAPTVTISGNPLEFVSNGATTPTLNLNGSGTVKPLLTISNNIVLTNNLSITGTSDGVLSGAITGASSVTKTGSGKLTLSGDNSGFTGQWNVTGGNLIIGASNSINSSNAVTLSSTGGFRVLASGTTTTIGNLNGSGNGTIQTNGMTTGTGTLVVTQSVDGSVSNVIADHGMMGTGILALTMSGAGHTLTLTGANTYSGGTTVTAGVLKLSGSGTLGSTSGSLTVNTGGTLDLNGTNQGVGNLTGSGGLIYNNSPGTNVTLTIGNGNGTGGNYSGEITDFAGTVALIKTGTGTITLSGPNAYTGTTTVSAGILDVQSNTALGTTAGATIVTAGAAVQVDGTALSIAEPINTLNGTGISNGGALRNLANSNTWSGAITLGSASRINSDAGTLTLTGGITGTGLGLTVGGAGNTTISTTGINTGSGGTLTKDGNGTLTISAAGNYTGGTTVNDGLLQLNSTSALGSTSGSLTVNAASGNAAILDLNGNSISVGNLTGTGGNIWNNGPNAGSSTVTLTIGTGNTGGGNYQGVISNNNGAAPSAKVALTKTGSGAITLSGANTYTGATTVNGGTLLINGSTAAGSAVTVNSSGTLGGSGTVGGTVDVKSGGTLSPGTSPGTLHTGALTLENGSTFAVDLTASSGNDLVVAPSVTLGTIVTGPSLSLNISGTLSIGQQFFIVNNTGANAVSGLFAQGATVTSGAYTFTIDYLANFDTSSAVGGNDIMLEVTAVPEPGTWVGGSLALVALAFSQRRGLKRLLVESVKLRRSHAPLRSRLLIASAVSLLNS